jgi:nickel-dependent lactate racemase
MNERFQVPFGRESLSFSLPEGMTGRLIESQPRPWLPDIHAATRDALARPIGSPPLRDLARPGQRVCLVFTDATRLAQDDIFVPALLAELEAAGIHDRDITLLCGVGMHRPSTPEEKQAKVGARVLERYRVVDHDARNPEMLVDLGTDPSGIPLWVNRIAHEADLVIATGVVEPHQYAGYSGGRKTLAIGAAGEATIEATHGPWMIDHPGTRLGRTHGNLFHQALVESARRAGLSFILNVVQDDHKRPVAVFAGAPQPTFQALVDLARPMYEVPVPRAFDVAVAGVGYPKDENLYQACRAASYLFFAPTPVVRDGGVIIVPAPTPEGAGRGLGEQRFLETMARTADMTSLLADLRRTGYPPGAQRAFIMAKVMEKCAVIVAGTRTPEVVRAAHMTPARDMDEALAVARDLIGRPNLSVAIVPRALLTLPVVREG